MKNRGKVKELECTSALSVFLYMVMVKGAIPVWELENLCGSAIDEFIEKLKHTNRYPNKYLVEYANELADELLGAKKESTE